MELQRAIIGGERVAPGAFEDVDPATGRVFAEVARCGAAEVDRAVAAARETFESGWRRTLPAERARLLHEVARLLRRDHEALAQLESRDTGKPLRQARADVTVAARYFEFYAGTSRRSTARRSRSPADCFAYTMREPFGVTGHIIPWNYPLQISAPHDRAGAARRATAACSSRPRRRR